MRCTTYPWITRPGAVGTLGLYWKIEMGKRHRRIHCPHFQESRAAIACYLCKDCIIDPQVRQRAKQMEN